MGVVFQFKKRNQYIDTEVWISYLCWHVTKYFSFDAFPPYHFKMLKPFLAHRPYKIGNGLDLGGGLWFADICCGEMIECTLTTWVKNEGVLQKVCSEESREAIWWTGEPGGFVLKLRAWSVFSWISLTCVLCTSGNSSGSGGVVPTAPWRHQQCRCTHVLTHSAHLYWSTYCDSYTLMIDSPCPHPPMASRIFCQ